MGKLIGGVKPIGGNGQAAGNRNVQPFEVTESVDIAGVVVLAHQANFIPGDIVYLKQGSTILGQGTVDHTVTGTTFSGTVDTNRVSIFWTPVTLVAGVVYTIDSPGTTRFYQGATPPTPYGKVTALGEMLGGASGTTDLTSENRLNFELVDTATRIADATHFPTSLDTVVFPMHIRPFYFPPIGWGVARTSSFEYIQWPQSSIDNRYDAWMHGVLVAEGDYTEPTVGQIWPR